MKVKLFQLSPEEDRYNLLYMHYEFAMSHGGIKESSYELVFDGELDLSFDICKNNCVVSPKDSGVLQSAHFASRTVSASNTSPQASH